DYFCSSYAGSNTYIF
nr:immunoglobulin light chain junction region [Macaca mulatta]MOW07067.1 immunoglobulin light chain junction region [Macaca mulatta]